MPSAPPRPTSRNFGSMPGNRTNSASRHPSSAKSPSPTSPRSTTRAAKANPTPTAICSSASRRLRKKNPHAEPQRRRAKTRKKSLARMPRSPQKVLTTEARRHRVGRVGRAVPASRASSCACPTSPAARNASPNCATFSPPRKIVPASPPRRRRTPRILPTSPKTSSKTGSATSWSAKRRNN